MESNGLTKNALATRIGVPVARIGEITLKHRGITGDTDIRLSRYFGTTEGYWLLLQKAYDLEETRRNMAASLG